MATVTVIQPITATETNKLRVAAYCRVSSSSEDQLNSYQAQLTYYSHKFEDSTTEELVELYMHLSLVGAKSAEKITTQILDALECLKASPYMGRTCEERILAADEYRKLIVGKYLCFYRVIADTVYVYHIVNGKRDYPKIFEEEQQ